MSEGKVVLTALFALWWGIRQQNQSFLFPRCRWASSVINNVEVDCFLSNFLSSGSYIISSRLPGCFSSTPIVFLLQIYFFVCHPHFLPNFPLSRTPFLFMWLTATQAPFHVFYSFSSWRCLSSQSSRFFPPLLPDAVSLALFLLWWNFSLPTMRPNRPVTNS